MIINLQSSALDAFVMPASADSKTADAVSGNGQLFASLLAGLINKTGHEVYGFQASENGMVKAAGQGEEASLPDMMNHLIKIFQSESEVVKAELIFPNEEGKSVSIPGTLVIPEHEGDSEQSDDTFILFIPTDVLDYFERERVSSLYEQYILVAATGHETPGTVSDETILHEGREHCVVPVEISGYTRSDVSWYAPVRVHDSASDMSGDGTAHIIYPHMKMPVQVNNEIFPEPELQAPTTVPTQHITPTGNETSISTGNPGLINGASPYGNDVSGGSFPETQNTVTAYRENKGTQEFLQKFACEGTENDTGDSRVVLHTFSDELPFVVKPPGTPTSNNPLIKLLNNSVSSGEHGVVTLFLNADIVQDTGSGVVPGGNLAGRNPFAPDTIYVKGITSDTDYVKGITSDTEVGHRLSSVILFESGEKLAGVLETIRGYSSGRVNSSGDSNGQPRVNAISFKITSEPGEITHVARNFQPPEIASNIQVPGNAGKTVVSLYDAGCEVSGGVSSARNGMEVSGVDHTQATNSPEAIQPDSGRIIHTLEQDIHDSVNTTGSIANQSEDCGTNGISRDHSLKPGQTVPDTCSVETEAVKNTTRAVEQYTPQAEPGTSRPPDTIQVESSGKTLLSAEYEGNKFRTIPREQSPEVKTAYSSGVSNRIFQQKPELHNTGESLPLERSGFENKVIDGSTDINFDLRGQSVPVPNISGTSADVTFHGAALHSTPGIGQTESNEKPILTSIVHHVKFMIKQGKSSAVIKLEPPNLGKIKLDIVTNNLQVTGKITVESQEVKEIIQNSLAQLRENLAQSGLKVDSFDVYVGHNDTADNWGKMDHYRNFVAGGQHVPAFAGDTDVPVDVQTMITKAVTNKSMYSEVIDVWI